MKKTLYVILLIASFVVGVGAMLWPAYEAAKDAFASAGRQPGEYPGDHDCPPGQTPIEVVTGFREVFGGTTSTGTRTALFCEDASGNRVNVSGAELNSEVSSILRKVVIGIVVSIVAWIVFAVLVAAGAKSMLSDLIHRSRTKRATTFATYSVNVAGGEEGATTAGLDPQTAKQVSDILEGLGLNVGGLTSEPAEPDRPSGPTRTVAQRLQELSDLREAGLITRGEYEEQRRTILRSLGEG
jgi:hypothetical protein